MYLQPGNVGSLVAELRELRGVSQTDLAKRIGMTQAFVNKVEKGVNQPSLPALLRVLDGLDAVLVIQLKEDSD